MMTRDVDRGDLAIRLSEENLTQYTEDGFLRLQQVVPGELLTRTQQIIEPWVDHVINQWIEGGLLADPLTQLDFSVRFLEAWRRAGSPHFRRSPNRFLINAGMYELLRSPFLLDLVGQLLGTSEISVHGIFNARPQLPGTAQTRAPWHQDSQYWSLDYGSEPDVERRTHVVTLWMPLQHVDEHSGCLQVMSKRDTGDRLFEPVEYDFKNTGFLGLSRADVERYPRQPMIMERGDVLMLNQRTPHGTSPHLGNHIRWSLDIRYEATASATVIGRKYGFVAQSLRDPASVTPLDQWLEKRPS